MVEFDIPLPADYVARRLTDNLYGGAYPVIAPDPADPFQRTTEPKWDLGGHNDAWLWQLGPHCYKVALRYNYSKPEGFLPSLINLLQVLEGSRKPHVGVAPR